MRFIKTTVISMTLGDLNPDFAVTAIFEVEYLGPDWSYDSLLCQVRAFSADFCFI